MAAPDARREAPHSDLGQTSAEYLGILVVVAGVIAVLAAAGLGRTVSDGLSEAVCAIRGGESCGAERSGAGSGDPTVADLKRREDALGAFAAREGGMLGGLLDQARTARERGDLAEADRLLDRLELEQRLIDGSRGELVRPLAVRSDADFDRLVAQGTIDLGDTNRRFFRVPPSPGDGIVAMDFFIPGSSSGLVLEGDDREVADPLLGGVPLDKSRVTVIVDRDTGRAVIHQSRTCSAGTPLGSYCEGPRPIELRDPRTRPQINPLPGSQAANEFDVDGGDGELAVGYDALNSITPVGVSVDGRVELERGPDGYYRVARDTRDDYPAIATYQYKPGEAPRRVDYDRGKPVFQGATPRCDLPDLPDPPGPIPDLPDLPSVPGPC